MVAITFVRLVRVIRTVTSTSCAQFAHRAGRTVTSLADAVDRAAGLRAVPKKEKPDDSA
jgi:hypothetical protein